MKQKLRNIGDKNRTKHAERIISQLLFAEALSEVNDDKFEKIIRNAVGFIEDRIEAEGALTKSTAAECEKMLSVMSADAKKYSAICAAHAHIDMNWMWGFAETVAITLDTFRTMLDMMNEYPDFRFSQSQASVYKIVEEYDPVMLDEIRKRVREGRWEVTASSWVETDKNMPDGESLARHILYTKRYLSGLLGIEADSLQIDFEPDTFGHNANVPAILARAGVKYHYHCRGEQDEILYRWRSPNKSEVISYRDPNWYLGEITPENFISQPGYSMKTGLMTMLKVYGVGNHGGGPTRKDIEKILEMGSWPVFPDIRFGTFIEFFREAEKIREKLPVREGELNFIFPGCYTSQSRIKLANRTGERKLKEAETFCAVNAVFNGGKYEHKRINEAWSRLLFSHFHDILPGSGVIDTREYAMGEFQKLLADTNTETAKALRSIASEINTADMAENIDVPEPGKSEGGGVGHGISDFGLPATERGLGLTRFYHLFNPLPHERTENTEIVVWDWPGDPDMLEVKDPAGKVLEHQLLSNDIHRFFGKSYWGHEYLRVLVRCSVPPCGYTTCVVSQAVKRNKKKPGHGQPVVESPDRFILENEKIYAGFSTVSLELSELYSKQDNKPLIASGGVFRIIDESAERGMTSWIVGKYMNIEPIDKNVEVTGRLLDKNTLRQWISYKVKFRDSLLKVTVSLDKGADTLEYRVCCDWRERAGEKGPVPQLGFYLPLLYECGEYKYDIPYGVIQRKPLDHDVPANSFAFGVQEGGTTGIMLSSDSKYGFRCLENSMSMTLIRSSFDPDPNPENYIHEFRMFISVKENVSNSELINESRVPLHAIKAVSGRRHGGLLPAEHGYMSVIKSNVCISALKLPEDGTDNGRLLLRLYEADNKKSTAEIWFAREIKTCFMTDINENILPEDGRVTINKDTARIQIDAGEILTLIFDFM